MSAAIDYLKSQLPASWKVLASTRSTPATGTSSPIEVEFIEVQSPPGNAAALMIEARDELPPREVERLFRGAAKRYRLLNPNMPVLVVARWLSSRSQELLQAEGINYLDLTGNVRIAVDYPPLYIRAEGATRDPTPLPRPRARVRGPKADRLIRFLIDVMPPYGVSEVAKATGLAPGYVSRLLDTLDEEALVERSKQGRVTSGNFPGLLRRWSETYDVFDPQRTSSFVAPNGPADVLEQIRRAPLGANIAVTGSFAAVRIAPVAAPSLLVAYCSAVGDVSRRLGLLPSDRGANVVLLTPFDKVVWDRVAVDGSLRFVAISQATIDCLTGNGRMPSEGEALLSWMEAHEDRWRLPSLASLDPEQE